MPMIVVCLMNRDRRMTRQMNTGAHGFDIGQVIEGGKEIYDAWKDGASSDQDELAEQIGETAKGATKVIQGLTNDFKANIPITSIIDACRSSLYSVSWVLMKLAAIPRGWEAQAGAEVLSYFKRADAALQKVHGYQNILTMWMRDSRVQEIRADFIKMSQDVKEEKIRFGVSNEPRSWESLCKAFLKVWDVIVKVVDAIFRGKDFDENVLFDAVEQKLGRSFQTRKMTHVRVDGGVWVHGIADDIALSVYYHDSKAHSVAIKTGISARILPEKQQIAQAGEWAIAIGPVESADGNEELYRLE